MRSLTRIATASLAVLLVLGCAMVAQARDSEAPKQAGDRWLPCEPWVMYHWLPFESRELYKETGITRDEWHDYIAPDDDNHTLGKLIEKHGQDPAAVVQRLMLRWEGRVSATKLAELNRRATALMTQGHLAQHVFFHYFHHPMLGIRAVASGQTTRAQSRQFLVEQRRWVPRWLNQSVRPRGRPFPVGSASPAGTRDVQACQHMAGAKHISGPRDPGARTTGTSMYCDLPRRR